MQFLAVRSDRPLPPEFRDQFVETVEVECFKCNQVRYHLYAPILETESDQITAQAIWLDEHLPAVCPGHLDWFLTPDRPGG
jgi:hypothetical protein